MVNQQEEQSWIYQRVSSNERLRNSSQQTESDKNNNSSFKNYSDDMGVPPIDGNTPNKQWQGEEREQTNAMVVDDGVRNENLSAGNSQ